MKCEMVQNELTALVVDDDGGGRTPELEAHLVICEACRSFARDERNLWQDLGDLSVSVPAGRLRARFEGFLDSLEAEKTTAHPFVLDPGRPRRGSRSPWIALAIAACLLLGIGVGRWTAPPRVDSSVELADLQRQVGSLNQLVALSLLQQESAAARLEGVRYGRQAAAPSSEVLAALSERIVRDRSTNVRLAAVEALAPLAQQPEVQKLLAEALAVQDSPLVQIALVDLLLTSEQAESQLAIDTLFDNPSLNPEVRSHIMLRRGGEV